MLEIVDDAFNQIALSADSYAENLRGQRDVNLRQEKLNSISFTEFMKKFTARYGIQVDEIRGRTQIIEELERFGIAKIDELERLLAEFVDSYKQSGVILTEIGFVRTAMMNNDMEKHLNTEPAWGKISKENWKVLKSLLKFKYQEDEIKEVFKKFGKTIQGESL